MVKISGKSFGDTCTVEPQDFPEDLNFDDLVRHIDDGKFNVGFALVPVETFTVDLRRNTAPHVYVLRDVATEDKEKKRDFAHPPHRGSGIPWVIGAPQLLVHTGVAATK